MFYFISLSFSLGDPTETSYDRNIASIRPRRIAFEGNVHLRYIVYFSISYDPLTPICWSFPSDCDTPLITDNNVNEIMCTTNGEEYDIPHNEGIVSHFTLLSH
jgi:hypothetical protein